MTVTMEKLKVYSQWDKQYHETRLERLKDRLENILIPRHEGLSMMEIAQAEQSEEIIHKCKSGIFFRFGGV